jgi:putative transposase
MYPTASSDTPGSAVLRRGRCSLSGQIYLVTTTTAGRRPLFVEHDLAVTAARTLSNWRLWQQSKLLCWVLMPDHWHAIIELGDDESLSDLMRRVKTVTAFEVNRARRASMAVWGSGFHDHALRFEEDLIGVARYVVLNPVRAGLVQRVGDYSFWDAIWVE